MKPTVLLFDIDGTLLASGGTGRRALQRAFQALHGRSDACDFPYDGMTDRRIARMGLEAAGVEATPARLDEVLSAYLVHLAEEVRRAEAPEYRLLPGMRGAVEAALRAAGATFTFSGMDADGALEALLGG